MFTGWFTYVQPPNDPLPTLGSFRTWDIAYGFFVLKKTAGYLVTSPPMLLINRLTISDEILDLSIFTALPELYNA